MLTLERTKLRQQALWLVQLPQFHSRLTQTEHDIKKLTSTEKLTVKACNYQQFERLSSEVSLALKTRKRREHAFYVQFGVFIKKFNTFHLVLASHTQSHKPLEHSKTQVIIISNINSNAQAERKREKERKHYIAARLL